MDQNKLNSIYPNPDKSYSQDNSKVKKKFPFGIIFKIIIYLLLVLLVIYFVINWNDFKPYYDLLKTKIQNEVNDLKNRPTPTPSLISTATWQTFKNQNYCYEILYPSDWVYYPWESPFAKATSDAYKETIAFELGPKKESSTTGGDIRILSFKEDLENTIKDIKSATEVSSGPNKLVEEIDVNLNGKNFRKLSFSRFHLLPSNFDSRDLQIYYITGGQSYSYVFLIPPYPKYLPIDQKILETFKLSAC